jgi:hypothetical protein
MYMDFVLKEGWISQANLHTSLVSSDYIGDGQAISILAVSSQPKNPYRARNTDMEPSELDMQAIWVIPPQFDQYGYAMWILTQAEPSAAVIRCSLVPLQAHALAAVQKVSSVARYD